VIKATEQLSSLDETSVLFGKMSIFDPALAYVQNIRDKHPGADPELVRRLGQANWERHIRIRRLMGQDVTDTEGESTPHCARSDFKPASTLRDSGIGTSIRTPPPLYAYEPSVVTSIQSTRANTNGNGYHFRIPEMPQEESPGRGFPCPICRRHLIDIQTRSDWKYASPILPSGFGSLGH